MIKSYPTLELLAASCAAQRVNTKYVKHNDLDKSNRPNAELIGSFLENPETITAEDREMANKVHTYYKGKTFALLSEKYVGEYDRNLLKLLEQEECPYVGLGRALIASAPSSYLRAVERDSRENRIRWASGGYVGELKASVTVECEVLKSIYSANWGKFYITAITPNDQIILFPFTEGFDPHTNMTVRGTVVQQQENNVTRLSRVKVL